MKGEYKNSNQINDEYCERLNATSGRADFALVFCAPQRTFSMCSAPALSPLLGVSSLSNSPQAHAWGVFFGGLA
jgi:hypothetical protein